MNVYTDMSNIENSRNCLRRIIHDDQEFSNQSIINVIERFVKTVNLMEETILVPSRLMDRQVGDPNDSIQSSKMTSQHHHHHHNKKKLSGVRDHLVNTDLFNLYNITSTISDSESDVSSTNENDSGIESEGQQEKDKSLEVAKQFRTHLLGLYKSLEQMTEAANYLTARYQKDIVGGNC
ncbi:CLUMA_CG006280, isoform A [Clunio marinus]|uniref:CLUMA_CG006280, isoform A n=1 Tax=Clunio marinus TaxID=568069 RepID=A0A1J1HXC5_9DIPT|nr:CLUMA_CG006280, isoform A [Clunio marinus]